MKSKFHWQIISVVVFALAVIGLLLLQVQPVDLAYDNNPESEIIYADLYWLAGSPTPGEECYAKFFPRLRIWGDGLVFLDVSYAGKEQPWYWSGYLTPDQIRYLLKSLQAQDFFGSWTPEGPNPSGTSLRIGAHLKTQSVEYYSGDLGPKLYTQLMDQIMPSLQPLVEQKVNDPRILSVLSEIKSCSQ